MRNGRPLRFLMVTVGGWTVLRVAMLWPEAAASSADAVLVASAGAVTRANPSERTAPPTLASLAATGPRASPVGAEAWAHGIVSPPQPRAGPAVLRATGRLPVAVALAGLVQLGQDPGRTAPDAGAIPPPLRPDPIAAAPSRWGASAWLLARGGSNGTLLGGQLGGSQAGARLTYALGVARRVALVARAATPLSGRGKEAAVGVEWQPTRAPVRLVAEQRVSLDGGKGGPTLMAIGGIGPAPVAAGFALESYAQAGAIARDGIEAFADGAARLTRPIAHLGSATLDLGAGSWGAAQRGAARLDVGPSLGLIVPVARRSLRLTLDYRQRIAGAARPGSGIALSIGSDF